MSRRVSDSCTSTERGWILSAVVVAALTAGCETTGNVDPGYVPGSTPDTGLVLLTVTNDLGPPAPISGVRSGNAARIDFVIRGPGLGKGGLRVSSYVEDSPFKAFERRRAFDEDVTGQYYVHELPAGRYEVQTWRIVVNHGIGYLDVWPRTPPPPLAFDVVAGSVIYLGDLHGTLRFGKMLGFPRAESGRPEVRDAAERDLRLILADYPQLEGRVTISLLPLGPWGSDEVKTSFTAYDLDLYVPIEK